MNPTRNNMKQRRTEYRLNAEIVADITTLNSERKEAFQPTNKLSWYPVAMYSGGRRQV
jgi:hypothetical protein